MLVSWSLRYWTKAECCGEPVSLVGPIVLLTNSTSDHILSALGKSPFWNGSAALAGSRRRSASADSGATDPATNLRREIAIVPPPQRVGHADDRAVLGSGQVVIHTASLKRQ